MERLACSVRLLGPVSRRAVDPRPFEAAAHGSPEPRSFNPDETVALLGLLAVVMTANDRRASPR